MSESAAMGDMDAPNVLTRVFGEDSGARQAFGFGVWFGAWRTGRLGRVGYVAAAFVLYGMLGLIQWFILDALEPDPIQLTPNSQPMSALMQNAALAASLAMSALTLVVGLNIAAKRFRHIGLPGWAAAAAYFVFLAGLTVALSGPTGGWAALGGLVLLALAPGGLIRKGAR